MTRLLLGVGAAAAAISVTIGGSIAAAAPPPLPTLVRNGSFEHPRVRVGSSHPFTSIPGWRLAFGPDIEIQNHIAGAAALGDQVVELRLRRLERDLPADPDAAEPALSRPVLLLAPPRHIGGRERAGREMAPTGGRATHGQRHGAPLRRLAHVRDKGARDRPGGAARVRRWRDLKTRLAPSSMASPSPAGGAIRPRPDRDAHSVGSDCVCEMPDWRPPQLRAAAKLGRSVGRAW